MKKLRIGLLAVAAIVSLQSLKAQTVDEIIDKHLTALGGKEKLASLKTVKMTGNLNTQGFDVGIAVTVVQGVGSRNDISVPGMGEGFQVMNVAKGWNFMPFMGQASPEEVSADQVKASQGLLDVQGSLLDYKDKGSKVELLGKEKIASADCYKLKLTNAAGKESTLFIDAATFYRVKSIVKIGEDEVENTYSDFKRNADGFVFPFSQTNDRGTIVFSSIETNKPVDEKIFTIN